MWAVKAFGGLMEAPQQEDDSLSSLREALRDNFQGKADTTNDKPSAMESTNQDSGNADNHAASGDGWDDFDGFGEDDSDAKEDETPHTDVVQDREALGQAIAGPRLADLAGGLVGGLVGSLVRRGKVSGAHSETAAAKSLPSDVRSKSSEDHRPEMQHQNGDNVYKLNRGSEDSGHRSEKQGQQVAAEQRGPSMLANKIDNALDSGVASLRGVTGGIFAVAKRTARAAVDTAEAAVISVSSGGSEGFEIPQDTLLQFGIWKKELEAHWKGVVRRKEAEKNELEFELLEKLREANQKTVQVERRLRSELEATRLQKTQLQDLLNQREEQMQERSQQFEQSLLVSRQEHQRVITSEEKLTKLCAEQKCEIASLNSSVEKLRGQCAKLLQTQEALTVDAESLEEMNNALKQRLLGLGKARGNGDIKEEDLEATSQALEEKHTVAQEHQKLRQDLDRERQKFSVLEIQIRKERRNHEKKLEELKQRHTALLNEVQALQEQHEKDASLAELNRDDRSRLAARIQRLEESNKEWEEKFKEEHAVRDSLESQLQELQDQRAREKQELEDYLKRVEQDKERDMEQFQQFREARSDEMRMVEQKWRYILKQKHNIEISKFQVEEEKLTLQEAFDALLKEKNELQERYQIYLDMGRTNTASALPRSRTDDLLSSKRGSCQANMGGIAIGSMNARVDARPSSGLSAPRVNPLVSDTAENEEEENVDHWGDKDAAWPDSDEEDRSETKKASKKESSSDWDRMGTGWNASGDDTFFADVIDEAQDVRPRGNDSSKTSSKNSTSQARSAKATDAAAIFEEATSMNEATGANIKPVSQDSSGNGWGDEDDFFDDIQSEEREQESTNKPSSASSVSSEAVAPPPSSAPKTFRGNESPAVANPAATTNRKPEEAERQSSATAMDKTVTNITAKAVTRPRLTIKDIKNKSKTPRVSSSHPESKSSGSSQKNEEEKRNTSKGDTPGWGDDDDFFADLGVSSAKSSTSIKFVKPPIKVAALSNKVSVAASSENTRDTILGKKATSVSSSTVRPSNVRVSSSSSALAAQSSKPVAKTKGEIDDFFSQFDI